MDKKSKDLKNALWIKVIVTFLLDLVLRPNLNMSQYVM